MTPENGVGPSVTLGLFDWVDADGVREAGQLYRERARRWPGSPNRSLPRSAISPQTHRRSLR